LARAKTTISLINAFGYREDIDPKELNELVKKLIQYVVYLRKERKSRKAKAAA
jgi:hypothetical protein